MNLCMCIQRTVHACIKRSPTVLHFCLEKLKCFFLNTHKVLGYSCHVSFYTREGTFCLSNICAKNHRVAANIRETLQILQTLEAAAVY